jgi:hypothetical protein
MFDFLDSGEKIISSIAGLLAIFTAFFKRKVLLDKFEGYFLSSEAQQQPQTQSQQQSQTQTQQQSQTQHQVVNQTVVIAKAEDSGLQQKSVIDLKKSTSILFIDDDKTFKIVDILKRMGWVNTKIIKDINSLEDPNLVSADVLFIDIQGVGKLLQFKEEGLGLALAIKKRHPKKKIVIYSAQEDGSRFHEALCEADYSLPKTADPMRFEEVIIKVVGK